MNQIYRVVFNTLTGAWQAVSEIARGRSKSSRSSSSAALGTLCGLLLGFTALPAQAICSMAASIVTCNGAANPLAPSYSNGYGGLSVNVNTGASLGTLLGVGGTSLSLTGSSVSLSNAGTINSSLLGPLSIQSTAVLVGNTASGSTVSITNESTGVIAGTGALLGSNLLNLTGMALDVRNAAGGTTTISNDGTIRSSALAALTLISEDTPVVAVTGGSTVNMTNTGTIIGRVAFEASSTGNTFTNAGTIDGSVSLGAGGGDNQFVAVTGSSVSAGLGVGTALNVTSNPSLSFAAAGIVDGGSASNNSLVLQNSTSGPGSGRSGAPTTLAWNQYINFQKLTINSGTWNLQGGWTGTGTTTLNDGLVNFNHAGAFGSGQVTVNGGAIAASGAGLTLGNNFNLNAGLTLDGTLGFGLNGVLQGSGGLIINNTGVVTLAGANLFAGGVNLNAGGLVLGNGGALGTGALIVGGNTTLDGNTALTLGNAVNLGSGASLNLLGGQPITFNGVIAGAGGLVKNGGSTLTLNAFNTFGGGLALNAGGLLLGNAAALGTGALNVGGVATLDASSPMSMGNNINLGAGSALNVLGSSTLTLGGAITGSGSLVKNGAATLTLTGTNTYGGGTTISGGSLVMASGSSLASSLVTVASGATLGGSGILTGSVSVASGGTLAPGASNGAGSLAVGSLNMSQGSTLAVALGTPGANFQTPGQGTSVSVTGDLELNGVSLSVTDAGGFGPGLYRLFDYGGALTMINGGFAAIPTGVSIQSLTADKKINLINTQGVTLGFWNANGQASSTAMGGGSGTWSNTKPVWTDATASFTAAMSPQPGFAIFGGAPGTVTVDSAAGAVKAVGLQFASDGYRLNGDALSLVADAGHAAPIEIRVGDGSGASSSWTATVDNVLAGTDGLKKTGAGTLVLNGSNTYSGGTTVAAGTLSVSSDHNLGSSADALTFDGGTVQVTGTAFTGNGSRNWEFGNAGGGIEIADAANSFTLSSALTGTGNLLKTGAGSLTLTGANNYSGTTTIDGGKLVASAANLGSGAITNNASLELNEASDATLGQAISGSGTFTKTGAGKLTLAGANISTGTTVISAGTLVASVASLGSGAITNNAALELHQASDGNLTQIISGTGSLTKTGTGALNLSSANTYSGGTTIGGGTLVAANAGVLGTGDVTVGNGAALEVTSGTTLLVGGDLTFQAGSTYRVQADPASFTSSKISVDGTATLGGSVLHVGPQTDAATDFQVGKTYTILHASQINGSFSAATSNYAYLDAALGYQQTNGATTDVTLKLQRKSSSTGGGDMGFAELAETRNQSSTANAISSLPSTSALYQFVEKLPAGAPAAVLASLSGDTHGSVSGSLVGLGAFAPSVSGQHLRNNITAGFRAGAPVAQSDGPLPASAWPSSKALPAWAEVVGHWQRYDGDGNAAQLNQRTTGLFLGMDQEVGTSGWRLGGSLGYTNADGKVADRSSESDVNSYSAAVYGGKSFGTGTGPRINVLGGLAYTWHDIETTRRVTSLGQTLKADYSAHTAQLFAEVGYAIGQYDKVGFEPFAGVSLGQQRTGSFQEHGGFAALKGRSNTDDLASTTLGLRVHSDFQLAGKEGRLRATVGWRHAFGDVTAKKTMAFEGGQNFTVAGTPLARNTAVLGLEADVALSRTAALVLGYQGEMGSGQRDHSASVKLRWAF